MVKNHNAFTQVPLNLIEEQVNNNNKASPVENAGFKFGSIPPPPSSFDRQVPKLARNGMVTKNDTSFKFKCKYCEKRFDCKQALSGHQNAHRLIKFLEKHNKNVMIVQKAVPGHTQAVKGNHIANCSHISSEGNSGFNGDLIPIASPANLLSSVEMKHVFPNVTKTGDNVLSNAIGTFDTIESRDLEKLQIEDSKLDLTLKLGH